jgi:hypothetical protein
VVSFKLRLLYSLERRLVGLQSRPEFCEEDKLKTESSILQPPHILVSPAVPAVRSTDAVLKHTGSSPPRPTSADSCMAFTVSSYCGVHTPRAIEATRSPWWAVSCRRSVDIVGCKYHAALSTLCLFTAAKRVVTSQSVFTVPCQAGWDKELSHSPIISAFGWSRSCRRKFPYSLCIRAGKF